MGVDVSRASGGGGKGGTYEKEKMDLAGGALFAFGPCGRGRNLFLSRLEVGKDTDRPCGFGAFYLRA